MPKLKYFKNIIHRCTHLFKHVYRQTTDVHKQLVFDADSKPTLVDLLNCTLPLNLNHVFLQTQFPIDLLRRQYSLILVMLWHIFCSQPYLKRILMFIKIIGIQS